MAPTPPGMSSKIMGLKFMQRQAQRAPPPGQPAAAPPAPPVSAAQQEAQWSLPSAAAAAPRRAAQVLTDETAPPVEGAAAVLRFKAGRRSFGNFNPRLEKRLEQLHAEKEAAAAALASAAAEEAQRAEREAERAALQAKADAHEAVERENAVSESEMASHYAKYLKPKPREVDLPEVSNPIHVRDRPRDGADSGRGANFKRPLRPSSPKKKKFKR
ncbi:hypothetical protein AB1Y20_008606 [Prymnesium parvum]|uniref:Nuclear speckle splicing regulatory protein 1 N-terminal domain-containing protein n=1 Tax=Prymnesium parvum TaxID=97485 RepID=A0AB34IV02_PRYPA